MIEDIDRSRDIHPTMTSDCETNMSVKSRRSRKNRQKEQDTDHPKNDDLDSMEDESSAWKDCMKSSIHWGGRGQGGRGEYSGAVNSIRSNIHLSNVNILLTDGTELLQSATMDISKGRKYGLVGRNGVGKSTLLKRLSKKTLPGLPQNMRILYVQQEISGSDISAIDTLIEANEDRTRLLNEQTLLENMLESTDDVGYEAINRTADRLGDIAIELEAMGSDTIYETAIRILKGLQFSDSLMKTAINKLSGGWRMRLALARALLVPSDLVLLDECTNHLDLHGLSWLISYLRDATDQTFVIASHDRAFLDSVCTDTIRMEHKRLTYFAGSYSEHERQLAEKVEREAHVLDAAERQHKSAESFIRKQQASRGKHVDPKKQRQAAMVRHKKLDRIGNYRDDGKRYKTRSLKSMNEKSLRQAQKVTIEVEQPVVHFRFPAPLWPNSVSQTAVLVSAETYSFGYSRDRNIVSSATFSIDRGSKIALVGRNGCGKSTLLENIANTESSSTFNTPGTLSLRSDIRIGYINQYSVEDLNNFNRMTVVEYAKVKIANGKAAAAITSNSSGNIRQYLGCFGLGGDHAHKQIGKLSGGERMRLCFATAMADEPHLLILDESTNHVDIETLEALSGALKTFDGSVLIVSHNRGFLAGFCNTLWVLDEGKLSVRHSGTDSFDDMFSDYMSCIRVAGSTGAQRQKGQTLLSKKAARQRFGATEGVALL